MRLWQFASIPTCALVMLEACSRHGATVETSDASTTAASAVASEPVNEKAALERKLVLKLAAASFVASVSDQPGWPESDAGARRMGYLRNGAIVEAYDPPVRNDDCKDGWYELVEGGFVCGKVATIDLTSPRVKLAPKQPDRDAGMPYRYGVNLSDGTPLYRRVLSADDRKKYETHVDDSHGEEKDEEPALADVPEEPAPPRRHSRDKRDRDKPPPKDPFRSDAGRPQLRELRGRGVLVRKMARGFTVALDRDFKAGSSRWWRTTFGFAVPFDRIALQGQATKHVGNWFTGEAATVPLLPFATSADADGGDGDAGAGTALTGVVAFTTSGSGRKIEITEDDKGGFKVGGGAELPRRSAVLLTGREVTVSGMKYHQTVSGFWVYLPALRVAKPQIPADVGPTEKWIDVDLTRQQLVAFEGQKPVFATLISSGRRNTEDPERDFPTPAGTFRIREKHITTTMDGDVASDGPYSIEDVPWVMYFQGSYALHGAFWHDAFGNVRSHGCVNMSPEDARTLFGWAEPALPIGWHGVFAKDENSGSRVVIHEDPPPGKRRAHASQ